MQTEDFLSLSPDKELEVLSLGTDSHKLVFTDDVDVAPMGKSIFLTHPLNSAATT